MPLKEMITVEIVERVVTGKMLRWRIMIMEKITVIMEMSMKIMEKIMMIMGKIMIMGETTMITEIVTKILGVIMEDLKKMGRMRAMASFVSSHVVIPTTVLPLHCTF